MKEVLKQRKQGDDKTYEKLLLNTRSDFAEQIEAGEPIVLKYRRERILLGTSQGHSNNARNFQVASTALDSLVSKTSCRVNLCDDAPLRKSPVNQQSRCAGMNSPIKPLKVRSICSLDPLLHSVHDTIPI